MIPYLIILRPVNVAITFVSVLAVLFLASDETGVRAWSPALVAAMSAALICGGANVINDIFDVEIDRINKPGRPLVAGTITPKAAWVYWFTLSFLGVAVSVLINGTCMAVALGASAGLYLYSAYWKPTPLWGNLTVSFFTGLAFVYGGVAIGRVRDALWPAVFSFLFQLGREILKDVEDREGDGKRGARTFPIVYGLPKALMLASVIFGLVVVATALAFGTGFYDVAFLYVVLVGVYPLLAFVTVSMWKDPSPRNLRRLSMLLKVDMVVGVAAILAG